MIKLILLLLIGIFLPTYFYLRSLPLTINDAFNFDGKEFRIAHRCGKAVLPKIHYSLVKKFLIIIWLIF